MTYIIVIILFNTFFWFCRISISSLAEANISSTGLGRSPGMSDGLMAWVSVCVSWSLVRVVASLYLIFWYYNSLLTYFGVQQERMLVLYKFMKRFVNLKNKTYSKLQHNKNIWYYSLLLIRYLLWITEGLLDGDGDGEGDCFKITTLCWSGGLVMNISLLNSCSSDLQEYVAVIANRDYNYAARCFIF